MALAILKDGRDQGAIETAAGVGTGQLSRWKGDVAPNMASLAKVVRELGVSGHWLVTGTGDMRPTRAGTEAAAFHEIASIVDRVRSGGGDADDSAGLVDDTDRP